MLARSGCFMFMIILIISVARMGFVAKSKMMGEIAREQKIQEQGFWHDYDAVEQEELSAQERELLLKQNYTEDSENDLKISNVNNIVHEIANMPSYYKNQRNDYTSRDLKNVFSKILNPQNETENSFTLENTGTWTFFGNGKCKSADECYLLVIDEKGNFLTKIPLYARNDGHISLEPQQNN